MGPRWLSVRMLVSGGLLGDLPTREPGLLLTRAAGDARSVLAAAPPKEGTAPREQAATPPLWWQSRTPVNARQRDTQKMKM